MGKFSLESITYCGYCFGAVQQYQGIGFIKMSKIAVTGSNGFVGGNIANMLLAAGHEVIGLVRSQPEKELPWRTTVTDLSNISSITEATKGCVAIVHSGIANDFNKLQQNREYAYDSFVGLTQRVTHAANKNGAQIIYISTGNSYPFKAPLWKISTLKMK